MSTDTVPEVRPDLVQTDPPALLGGSCAACSQLSFPVAPYCPHCGAAGTTPVPLATEGTIYSFTVARFAPPGYSGAVPYAVGVVELPDGIRVGDHAGGGRPRRAAHRRRRPTSGCSRSTPTTASSSPTPTSYEPDRDLRGRHAPVRPLRRQAAARARGRRDRARRSSRRRNRTGASRRALLRPHVRADRRRPRSDRRARRAPGIPIINVENACSSGGAALQMAAPGARRRRVRHRRSRSASRRCRAASMDMDYFEPWRQRIGHAREPGPVRASPPSATCTSTARPSASSALVAVKNHTHSVHNDRAMYRKEITRRGDPRQPRWSSTRCGC